VAPRTTLTLVIMTLKRLAAAAAAGTAVNSSVRVGVGGEAAAGPWFYLLRRR
jgi:hypothetical protein